VTGTDAYIAVVDDEVSVRTMLGRLLRLAQYDVSAFACGGDFMESLATRRPDCLVLDIHMPGLSGLDVQSRLAEAHVAIPIVFVTASDDVALDRRVQQAGGVKLLRKPFSNAELLEAVVEALRRTSGDVS
jgi:FixJ family two-component response regulator